MHQLDEHSVELGLVPGSRRQRAARDAADLVVRLAAITDETTLVRQFATVAYETTDEELGSAITGAPNVARAFAGVTWPILGSLWELTQRQDGIGDQARRLTTVLAETANETERVKALAPVLEQTGSAALGLITEVSRALPTGITGTGATIVTGQKGPARADVSSTGADQTSLTFDGDPVVPSDPPPTAGRYRARRSDQAARLQAVRSDIERFLEAHPDAEIEITWRPVEGG
jgi:hypothetical protein